MVFVIVSCSSCIVSRCVLFDCPLFVDGRVLFVVRCPLFDVGCVLFVVCRLLFLLICSSYCFSLVVVCCLLSIERYLLFVPCISV